MTRDRDTRAPARTRRWRRALPAVVAALALSLAFATAGTASAATQPNIPGYNPAAIDRAITAVTKTSQAVTKVLHPRRKHPRRHH